MCICQHILKNCSILPLIQPCIASIEVLIGFMGLGYLTTPPLCGRGSRYLFIRSHLIYKLVQVHLETALMVELLFLGFLIYPQSSLLTFEDGVLAVGAYHVGSC